MFLAGGFRATTIQAIADASGVSKGAVYLHFSSKQDIFFDIAVQTEEIVWGRVQEIRNLSIHPRDKLVRILETFVEYFHDNRMLNELLVHEVGLTLTTEKLAEVQGSRIRWQQVIDDSVADLLGPEFDEWKTDLGFAVNGVIDGVHSLMLVENFDVATDSLVQFLLLLVETMGPALKAENYKPMLAKNCMDALAGSHEDLENRRQLEVESILKKMHSFANQQLSKPGSPEENRILAESIAILQTECKSKTPNKAIIQGMLASIRSISELSQYRQRLASLMNVKLI